ncbi:MAG TPA: hypothetical protein VGE47_01200 [Burkholderiaceae bacterium]
MRRLFRVALALLLCACAMQGFERSASLDEQTREMRTDSGVRIHYDAPSRIDAKKPTRVIVYALPNGNTIEQTLGARLTPGLDWHFDIQHIAAQTRRLREVNQRENIVLVLVEAEKLSWPAWRASHADANAQIATLLAQIGASFAGLPRIELMAHSGGGSFILGLIENGPLPAQLDRIAWLDANYSFDAERHGQRLLDWLQADTRHQLTVVAYDDRNITYEGKPVVGPTGGTWRASQRMLDFFAPRLALTASEDASWLRQQGLGGHIAFFLHKNPENKILHTRLVGEMNGFLMCATLGLPEAGTWGQFGGPRAYEAWVR